MDVLQCYNRGCGQKYNPKENHNDSCRHHPGLPFFHDAYKGWSCCNKKCTDFTEFLNIKGCTLSKHSNEKPPEPEKPMVDPLGDEEIIEVKPIVPSRLKRPLFETQMVKLKPEIAPSLLQQLQNNITNIEAPKTETSGEIPLGTICKNGGCNVSYDGPQTDDTTCVYHPGVPVFHEGMKFWSCCQKRTSDFDTFLNQVGCQRGNHVWIKDEDGSSKTVQCRWDYHQTGSHVIVSIYSKQYCPKLSVIKINPIRLYADIVFPQQSNASFNLDFELRGIVNVEESKASMYGTKVEIQLKKAEPGSWPMLEIPKKEGTANVKTDVKKSNVEEITPQIESVDLSDL